MIDNIFTVLQFPFIQRALLIGCIIGVTTAFLGLFVTLRNMSFYSDAISHAALAGIAIGLLLNVEPFIAAVVFCLLIGLGTAFVKQRSKVSIDTLMGVLFASGISLGIALISKQQGYQGDLFSFLFGDILATNWNDISIAFVLGLIIIVYLLGSSKRLLLTTFSPDFSFVRGVSARLTDYMFFGATALTIALSIKVIGIVLVTGLLIIPAAIGKNMAHSFKQAVLWSILASVFTTIIGIIASYYIDIPSGPAIILLGTILFVLTSLFQRR